MAYQSSFGVKTNGQGLYEFTSNVADFVEESSMISGVLTLFVQHTSCSILIQENADPSVQVDLQNFLSRLVPNAEDSSMKWLTHTFEGPDDMPAHIKSALLPTSISIPIVNGRLALGQWQGIYLFEHRDAQMQRNIIAHIS